MNYALIEYELILEEVAKLPKTADTCYVSADVLELVEQRIFDYEKGL
jgi:hypothetical protein